MHQVSFTYFFMNASGIETTTKIEVFRTILTELEIFSVSLSAGLMLL